MRRPGGALVCASCLEEFGVGELDRLLWCESCLAWARARAARQGWVVGTAIAALLGLWIWIWIRPSDLILSGWIAVVAAALWLTARIAREILFGVARFRGDRIGRGEPRPAADPPPVSEKPAEPGG